MFDDTKPIFLQLAERISDDILRGQYAEGDQVPSTNELSAHLRINPATAGKALGVLVDQGILVKRRGIGMFVAAGARADIANVRHTEFVHGYVDPLLAEARTLGISRTELLRIIEAESVRGNADGTGSSIETGSSDDTGSSSNSQRTDSE